MPEGSLSPQRLKLVFMVYDEGMEADVEDVCRRLQVPGYTRLSGAPGAGRSGPRLGDPIWPGLNHLLWVALPEAEVAPFIQAILAAKATFRLPPALKIFVTEAEVYD